MIAALCVNMIIRWNKNIAIKRQEERLSAIGELLELLQESSDSAFAVSTIPELVEVALKVRETIENGSRREVEEQIRLITSPTCAFQDVAVDNGWGGKYLELAARLS